MHQQGQLTIYNQDAADEEVSVGMYANNYDDKFTMDKWFRPDASHMATVLEAKRGGKVREVTTEGDIVWEYEYRDETDAPHMLFRAYRFAEDHPAITAILEQNKN